MDVRKHWGLCLAGAVLLAGGSVACGSDTDGTGRRGVVGEGGAGGDLFGAGGDGGLPAGGVGGGGGLLGVGGSGGLLGVGGTGGLLGIGGSGGLPVGGTGGAFGTGGALGAGGAFGTGGALGAGGAFGTGGALGAGGAFGTGGALGAGGAGGAIGGTGGTGGAGSGGGSVVEKDALCPAELTGVVDVYKTADQNPIDCVEKDDPATVLWTWELYNNGPDPIVGILADDMGGGAGAWICPPIQPAGGGGIPSCTLLPVTTASPPLECLVFLPPGGSYACTASYQVVDEMKASLWHHSTAVFLGEAEGDFVCSSEAENVHVIKCKKDGELPGPL